MDPVTRDLSGSDERGTRVRELLRYVLYGPQGVFHWTPVGWGPVLGSEPLGVWGLSRLPVLVTRVGVVPGVPPPLRSVVTGEWLLSTCGTCLSLLPGSPSSYPCYCSGETISGGTTSGATTSRPSPQSKEVGDRPVSLSPCKGCMDSHAGAKDVRGVWTKGSRERWTPYSGEGPRDQDLET